MTRTVYPGAALADGTGPELQRDVSLLVADDRIAWIRPADDKPCPGPDAEVVDAAPRGPTSSPGRSSAW